MSSLNQVMLIGRLGDNPDLRRTANKMEVANFSLATNESYQSKDGKIVKVEWHRIVAWGKTAANCAKFLKKGSLVFVEVKIQTRKYKKDDVEKYATEIIASRVQFLDAKKSEEASEIAAPEGQDPFAEIPF